MVDVVQPEPYDHALIGFVPAYWYALWKLTKNGGDNSCTAVIDLLKYFLLYSRNPGDNKLNGIKLLPNHQGVLLYGHVKLGTEYNYKVCEFGLDFNENEIFNIYKDYYPQAVSNYQSMYFSAENVLWSFGDAMWNPRSASFAPHNILIELWSVDDITTDLQSNLHSTETFHLFQNYPNPFYPSTTISYSIPQTSLVSIKVYDILGNEITTLINKEKPKGNYKVKFNESKLASGIYFY